MSNPDSPVPHKPKHHEVAKHGDRVDESHKVHKPASLGSEAAKALSSPGGNDAVNAHKSAAAKGDSHFVKHDVVIVSDKGKHAKLAAVGDASVHRTGASDKPAHEDKTVVAAPTAAGDKAVVAAKEPDRPAVSAAAAGADKSVVASPAADKSIVAAAAPVVGAEVVARHEGAKADIAALTSDAKPLRIVDKTGDSVGKFQTDAPATPGAKPDAPPQITVTLEDKGKPADKEPHYYIKKDGTVEMHGDPLALNSKDVRITLERDQGEINPTAAQKQAADQLVNFVNDKIKENDPQAANKVVLNDVGDVISQKAQDAAGLKVPPQLDNLTDETRHSVEETKRLHRSGGVDMPYANTDHMGSFHSRSVHRQHGETDQTAAMKESAAGLFKPDKDHPYETVRRHPDGGHRVGRYGMSGHQLASWLEGLTPDEIEKLIKEGKLPKEFSDPKFLEQMKEFAAKMERGEEPTPEEMKKFLKPVTQETIAGKLLDDLNKASGNNPGMAAAGFLSGRTGADMTPEFMNSLQAKELADAGKTLFDIATHRQMVEGDGKAVGGRVPAGDRRDLITKALEIAGKPTTEANISAVNTIVKHESGWKAGIVNNWDSNAAKGIPSQGLMQTIPPTFRSYRDHTGQVEAAGYSNTIRDPLANLVAGINYSYARYGSVQNVPGVRSLARGGDYRPY